MNLPIPEWMEGRSLLKPINRYEPIFGAASSSEETGIDPGPDAPVNMGGLTELGVIVCDHWVNAELESGQITQSQIVDHTTPCDPEDMPDAVELECMIGDHLAERGYKRVVGSECR
jgi:hypothetical protein